MRADTRLAQPPIDGVRLAEDQQLRAKRRGAPGAQDDVARPHVAVQLFGQPRPHREVEGGIEADEIDQIVMAADAGMLDPRDLLRRGPVHADDASLGEQILVEHKVGRLDGEQRCGDVGERAFRHDHHVGAQPREAHRHAAVDAAHQSRAGEDHAARDRDRRDQQKAAGLAAGQILQRQAGEQPQSVQERVCFMCSSLVGMITQSWCPPLLGRMPTRVSVEVSMTEMPLDWR